jgi:threonylcarbamoyladenosine tRNA methylthiotransferase MtaB
LAKAILRHVPEISRLRLSSIDSVEADDHLWDLIADEPRFMPHLHLSLQHGDNLILKRMKRRHSREDAIAFIRRARDLRPDMSFGADIIAGFPTETEAMFANSIRLAEECGVAKLHVFPFSPREGTPAARMPQLDRGLVKARAAKLRGVGERLHDAHLAGMAGTLQRILVENTGLAHTENFTLVDGLGLPPGTLAEVRIAGHNGKHLIATAIEQAAA